MLYNIIYTYIHTYIRVTIRRVESAGLVRVLWRTHWIKCKLNTKKVEPTGRTVDGSSAVFIKRKTTTRRRRERRRKIKRRQRQTTQQQSFETKSFPHAVDDILCLWISVEKWENVRRRCLYLKKNTKFSNENHPGDGNNNEADATVQLGTRSDTVITSSSSSCRPPFTEMRVKCNRVI